MFESILKHSPPVKASARGPPRGPRAPVEKRWSRESVETGSSKSSNIMSRGSVEIVSSKSSIVNS